MLYVTRLVVSIGVLPNPRTVVSMSLRRFYVSALPYPRTVVRSEYVGLALVSFPNRGQ